MILTDFPHILSFANQSDTNLANRPKTSQFLKFYRKPRG